METHLLRGQRFLEPMWFNRVRHGEHTSIVQEDGAVALDGEPLQFAATSLPAGTSVKVWLNASGHFVCTTAEAIAVRERERQERLRAEQEALARARDAVRDDALEFNARLTLPVRWDVGIKDVLSGLSETSMGHGRNKATVEHIYLLEPLNDGRLQRDAGDFLCTSANGSNGKRWSSVIERQTDGAGVEFVPKVTCKACLTIASRWAKKLGSIT